MKRNFQFDAMSVVRCGDRLVDLHNAYDLESFGTDLRGGNASLGFKRNAHAIGPDTLPSRMTLTCVRNVRVAFNDLRAIAAPLNEEGIEIAYFDDGCDWQTFLEEGMVETHKPQGLHVSFVNGLAVRIFCDEAVFAGY